VDRGRLRGKVRRTEDLVSEVIEFPFVNPQTGPFYVEGAEVGDTLALYFVSIEPSRDWAASSTIPLFGALTQTHATAGLQEQLPEIVWMYELDATARTVTYRARDGDHSVSLPMDPMHGTVGVAPASLEARSSLVPDAHGGNMDGDARRDHFATSVSMWRERCSRSGTATLARGRARPAAWRWSAPWTPCWWST
jgi:acetamidase/formamidase